MLVSALAASQGNAGIALGNAYGSNITNIALILGLTAVISPIAVHSQVLRKELPLLILVTTVAAWQLWDDQISRVDALILLALFALLMIWTVRQGMQQRQDTLAAEVEQELTTGIESVQKSVLWLSVGLVLLIISSRILVWGTVEVAILLGISDLMIGLTIVAVGTSLPELASSLFAARKGEHDIALGNIIGSNLFNTLAVVGIAGLIQPLSAGPEVFNRDMLVMAALTLSLFVFGYGLGKTGRINRFEGGLLLLSYASYTTYLIAEVIAA